MMESPTPQTTEAQLQLERLLRELLDKEGSYETGAPADLGIPPEIIELRDTARRLRAASQWVPLPEGRNAVRRALLATAQHGRVGADPARAAWRQTGRWLGTGGVVTVIVAAFALGAGVLDGLGSPSGPLYGLRLGLDDARVAIVPSPLDKAELLVRAAHARIAEIDEMVASGNTQGIQRAAAALDGEAAWLGEITATLPPADRQRLQDAVER